MMPQRATARDFGSRTTLERAQEALRSGDRFDLDRQPVRELVRASWRRSLAAIGQHDAVPPLELRGAALHDYRDAHPLSCVIEMIRALLLPDGGDDGGVVVAIGDAAGRLLWVDGDRALRARTADIGFVEGANWSEPAVGTSAPGTAIELGRAVQIRGAEHFNRLVHPWSCTATPLHDPETRRMLGVLDITGGDAAVTRQAQLLVEATARAVEGELLVQRMRSRERRSSGERRKAKQQHATLLRVLGRDRGLLESHERRANGAELSERHAELLLMLAQHRDGISAARLSELVYGDIAGVQSLRPEIVRLRRVLATSAPQLELASRPYRLIGELSTDAHDVLSLIDRGAHRVALSAYLGAVLPGSIAPGVVELRDTVHSTLREALMADGSVETLLDFSDTEDASDDLELLRLCLRLLPRKSPRRASVVARIAALERP